MTMTEKERQRIFSIVETVILNGDFDYAGFDLVIDVSYEIIEALEKEKDKNIELFKIVLTAIAEFDKYGLIEDYGRRIHTAKKITNLIEKEDDGE